MTLPEIPHGTLEDAIERLRIWQKCLLIMPAELDIPPGWIVDATLEPEKDLLRTATANLWLTCAIECAKRGVWCYFDEGRVRFYPPLADK